LFIGHPAGLSPLYFELTEIGWGCMGWIHLAQDMDQWRALVNKVINLQVDKNAGRFLSG
jgi:hypothetical protein